MPGVRSLRSSRIRWAAVAGAALCACGAPEAPPESHPVRARVLRVEAGGRLLAVHHEVQYLAFTYAMARREGVRGIGPFSYVLWPGLGLAGAVAGGWLELRWLAPLGIGGLFCHYWLDGRIWTRRVASP